ncbi:MAG: PEP-CTERM sorting domain-containing protein [Pirellulales bacterium]
MTTAPFAAPIVNLYYNSLTGNLKVQNTTSGTQSFQSIDIITLGNGSFGPATVNNQGYLSLAEATVPPASFVLSNTNRFGFNGLYSQVFAANISAAVFTLQPYAGWSISSPIGPAGSFLDLGNIAVLGMTQSDVDTRFLTDPEVSPGDRTLPGKFLFSYQTGPGVFSVAVPGDVVAVVPEPSAMALVTIAAGIDGLALRRRRCHTPAA